ncbi:MAG: zinc-finger domain-containing protein [Gammaproteobacteria bacterium]|nr:zinc-finger domain-containing protein [Gammaproteobacteria bacterium]
MSGQSNASTVSAGATVERHAVTAADLPLQCPPDDGSAWSSHPRVYLTANADGVAKCPYCGAEYQFKEIS